jgi:hypothetical protein
MSSAEVLEQPHDARRVSLQGQMSALLVDLMNALRSASEEDALEIQRDSLAKGLSELVNVREFIGTPESILGSASTKHGEIAEVMEVGLRNARDYVAQMEPTADVAPSRIAPEDIVLNGIDVQMKTINGTNNSLRHVLGHMDKYENFGRDESFYLIPKDQHAIVERVLRGDHKGLNKATVAAIQRKIEEIERLSGKPFDEVVRPASTTYAEVQQGQVHDTLDRAEDELCDENVRREQEIVDEHAPSLTGAAKAAAAGAAMSGAFAFVGSAANKYFKEEKNLFRGDFDADDWRDVGVDTRKAAVVGGISAAAIYGLTNFAGTAAPVAGAFVGAARGIAAILPDYVKGDISPSAFVDQALFLCTDVSITTMFTVAGQCVIPLPVAGALVGTLAGKFVSVLIGNTSKDLQDALAKRLEDNLGALGEEHRLALDALHAEFLPKLQLSEFAFASASNLRCLGLSVSLARMHGVPEEQILKSPAEVVAFLQAP